MPTVATCGGTGLEEVSGLGKWPVRGCLCGNLRRRRLVMWRIRVVHFARWRTQRVSRGFTARLVQASDAKQ